MIALLTVSHNDPRLRSEFLKRDDQILALRLQQEERLDQRKKAAVDRDRARAQDGQEGAYAEPEPDLEEDVPMDDAGNENFGSKTIIIHIGSQNLRIGFATDALPKTVPMVVARKAARSEAEDSEPCPKRLKLDDDTPSEEWFGEEVCSPAMYSLNIADYCRKFTKEYASMAAEFKVYRRQNRRRVLPNSRELVTKWNSTNPPEKISEHNDPLRVEWTEIPADTRQAPEYFVGAAALRIPQNSKPRYKLHWPVRHGWLNESDYNSRRVLISDFFLILEHSILNELQALPKKDWHQYSCVFVIPDLYEKVIVADILAELLRDFGFSRVCFLQESLAATFGAGFGAGCIVDLGAQKTSICCVEDGMCIEESRINMKYGGYDVTETFIRMMLHDRLNYSDLNFMRRHDFLLAEELKEQFTTMSDENIVVQTHSFHVRAAGEDTRKYQFKIYDEGMLAPLVSEQSSRSTHALTSSRVISDQQYLTIPKSLTAAEN
jgi:actin-related protein 8